MHLTFTPELSQVTAVPLAKLAEGATHYDLTFKASFDSPAAYEEARRDGTRVEMWTDLPAPGHGETGGWRALAFEYVGDSGDAEKGSLVISCVASERIPSPVQEQTAVYATVSVPAGLIPEGSMFSFTYRVVYSSGHVQWLGAYGQNGILEFAKRDVRVSFEVDGNEVRLSGQKGRQVGTLNMDLRWERWALDKNGVNFSSTSLATNPSRNIVLLPRLAPGSHSIVPLEPLTLTAEYPSGVSVTSEGDIVFRPYVFTTTSSESGVVKHITESGATLFISTNDGYPATLTAIPAKRIHSTHSTIPIHVNELLSILPSPSQEFLLFHKGSSNYHEISRSISDEVIVLQVPSSGGQFSLTPLFSITTHDEHELSVKVGLASPHSGAKVVPATRASALLPTPPPSPPAENTTLPGIDAAIESMDGEASSKSVDEAPEPEVESQPLVDEQGESQTVSATPSTLDLPGRYIPKTPPSSALVAQPRNPPLDVESILKFGMEYVMRLLLTRFFGALWIILAYLGWKSQETLSPLSDEIETVDVDEEDAEEEQADVPHVDDERLSEATAVDGTDGGEEIPEEVTEHVVKETDTKTEPFPVVSRPAYFAATVLNQAVAFVVRSSFVDGKPASPNLAVVFDGQPINNFKMEALSASSKSETTIHLVTFDGTASGGKVELMLN